MRLPLDVTVAIPAHPARLRSGMLDRALRSVAAQTLPPAGISVAVDVAREGAPATRQRALEGVRTPWMACLDSDDEFLPEHLQVLADAAVETGADYLYSWFHGPDPFPQHFGREFDPADPVETTSVILIRTELAREVGYAKIPERLYNTGEDFRLTLGCVALGAKIVHVPRRTWVWHVGNWNTSGLPTNGDAAL